jgi:hypothetical protein
LGVAAALGIQLTGCESQPDASPGPGVADAQSLAEGRSQTAFSGTRAFAHLTRLAELGPRQTGTRSNRRARRYLRDQLESAGVEVESVRLLVPTPGAEEASTGGALAGVPVYEEAVHLVGVLPGESEDRFLLAAAYDTRTVPGVDFVGANASGSGPALLVELARTLAAGPRPYTIMIALIDADRLPPMMPGGEHPGTRSLAAWIARNPAIGFDRIRLAVFFQQVADNELSLARDLRSHHVYREFFWEAAGVLGKGAYFEPDAPEESVDGSHVELIDAGLPRTVVIADPRFGGGDVPGRYAASAKDTPERCSPDSLEVVGSVTVEALRRIATRLSRIDRFRESPLEDPLADPR